MRKRLKNHFIPHEGNDYKPHFVRERNIIGVALLVVTIFGLASSVKTLVTKNPDLLSAVITGVLVDLTNSSRLSQNLSPLQLSPILASAAQMKANDMASKSYFAHTSPEGKTPWYWFTQGGYKFLYAGENLAVNFVDSEDVVKAWMNSEGHRANILNNKFTEIGIAMAPGTYNGLQSIYVVQLFGRPAPRTQTLKPIAIVEKESKPTSILKEKGTSISGAVAESPNVEILAESKMFIAVQNNDTVIESTEVSNTDLIPQVSIIDKILVSPKVVLKVIYLVIGGVVLIALILFITIKPRRQYTKYIYYVLLLLSLIIVLFFLSSVSLFPQIIIE